MNSPDEGTRTAAGVVISKPIAGLFTKGEDGTAALIERTEYVPNVPGRFFGCVFEYINDTGRVVPFRWELILPQAPATAATIDGTTTVYSVGSGNRVIVHGEGLAPGESSYHSLNRIDPGDPPGKWLMELYVGGELFDTLIFFIFSVS